MIIGEWAMPPSFGKCRTGKGKPKEQSERLVEV